MAFVLQSIILALNLFNSVYSAESPLTPTTNSSAYPRLNNGDDDNDDFKVTVAVVIGVSLTVAILGCVGFFLCRGHLERKKFQNHRQLVKIERKHENGKMSDSTEHEQSRDFAEEIL